MEALVVPDPEEARAVREAYERYATGNYTDREIADWLNEQGYRTRRGGCGRRTGCGRCCRTSIIWGW